MITPSDSRNVLLSIVVLHYRTAARTVSAIRSVQQSGTELSYEIIVIDNGSGDGSGDSVREACPNVSVMSLHENVGFAAGMNAGMRQARGQYVLLLNSDVQVQPRSMELMLEHMQGSAAAGLCAPVLVDEQHRLSKTLVPQPTISRVLLPQAGRIANMRWLARLGDSIRGGAGCLDVEVTEGAAVMVSRSASEVAGLMDEDFFFYHEIVEWCMRIRDNGFRVSIVTQAEMVHACGGSTEPVRRAARVELKRSEYQLLQKRLGQRLCNIVKVRDLVGETLSVAFYFLATALSVGLYKRAAVKLAVHWAVLRWICAGMPGRRAKSYIRLFGRWD